MPSPIFSATKCDNYDHIVQLTPGNIILLIHLPFNQTLKGCSCTVLYKPGAFRILSIAMLTIVSSFSLINVVSGEELSPRPNESTLRSYSVAKQLLIASATDDWNFPALGFKCSPKRPHLVESVTPGYEAAQKGILVGDEISDLESSADATNFVIKRAGKTYGVVLSSKRFHKGASVGAVTGPSAVTRATLSSNSLSPRNRMLSQPEPRLSILPTSVRPGTRFSKENLLALGQPAADWEVTPEWLAGIWQKVPGTTRVLSARDEKTGQDFVPANTDTYVMDGPSLGSERDKSGNIWFHATVPEMVDDKNVALVLEPAEPGSVGTFALHYRSVYVTANDSQIINAAFQEDSIDRFSPEGADKMTCDEISKIYDENGAPLSSWRATCQMRRVQKFVPNPGAKFTLPVYLRKRGLLQLIP